MAAPTAAGPTPVAPASSRRRLLVAGAFAVALVAVVTALLWPRPGPARPRVAAAVAFSLPSVRDGGPEAVLAARPGHPVVLNFFAAWCDPCHAELPLLAALQRREGSRLQVIGVDVQDNRQLAVQLLDGAGVGFPAGYDPDLRVSGAYRVVGLPVTLFIQADGRVLVDHPGQLRAAELDHLASRLVATGIPAPHRQT